MNILIVGGTGRIGKAVAEELKKRHTVITTGFRGGDIQVDIASPVSILNMYKSIDTRLDAVIATTGKTPFVALSQITEAHYRVGLDHKLMGQVNLVLNGLPFIAAGGSFTLTSGILNHDPIVSGTSSAMVNGALEGFVKNSAIEMPKGIRINLVSPTVISEAMDIYGAYFRGFKSVSVAEAALAYSKSVEGAQTGQVYRVGY